MAFDSLYEFRKVAVQRLRDAQELLELPTRDPEGNDKERRHLRGAMYLSGYTVECILKAYLIRMYSPLSTLSLVDNKLRKKKPDLPNLLGSPGHQIGAVLALTDLEADFDDERKSSFSYVAGTWTSTMRYNPEIPTRAIATRRVQNAAEIYSWVDVRL